jgi:hypothetical protein
MKTKPLSFRRKRNGQRSGLGDDAGCSAPSLSRRNFIAQLGLALAGAAGSRAAGARAPRILLRSSWQTVNIGDIAHTPGVLAILEKHLPDVHVTLWPSLVDNGVEEILRARFPKLAIAKRGSAELAKAMEACDFLLHGSGPSLVAERDITAWREATGKPYGVYGITLPPKPSTATAALPEDVLARTVGVLSGAAFVYFRDSRSLELARGLGCASPVMEFGPDGAFACDLRDDAAARAFLDANGLEERKFLCCIPRLRYTPYWTIKNVPFDETRHARNEAMKDRDHDPHIRAIVRVIEETDLKILLCPEDQTQMQVGREVILEKLPAAVRSRVVWRPTYWMPGEAVSTYRRSAGLFGNEMHSPIMCIGHGVPAIVCRWAEQTTKGYMWEDIGLGDWLFDFDRDTDRDALPDAVITMARDPDGARAKAAGAKAFVEERQSATMRQLATSLGL